MPYVVRGSALYQYHNLSYRRVSPPPPSASGIPVSYGPASRIPLNFEMESRIQPRILIKRFKKKQTLLCCNIFVA